MVAAIIGDQILRIEAVNKGVARQMTIANNVHIKNVAKKDFTVGSDSKPGMSFDFVFSAAYDETGSRIEVEGSILYIDDKKKLDEIEKEWNAKKQIEDEKLILPVLNRALEIGYVHAVSLADKLRLPPPIQMPKFVGKLPAEEKSGKPKAG